MLVSWKLRELVRGLELRTRTCGIGCTVFLLIYMNLITRDRLNSSSKGSDYATRIDTRHDVTLSHYELQRIKDVCLTYV
jgi:hypothetical protein